MLLLWIPIILIGAVSIVGTIFYFKKREFFLEHKSFVEFWGVVLSILFALFAFLQTQSSMESSTKDFTNIVGRMDDIISKAEESSKSLHNVDESLSKLPPQMNAFSESIQSFNDVISSQRNQLSSTLSGLNNSILDFKSAVDSMVKKFNRKPILHIDMITWADDTTRTIDDIVITNYGSLMADVNILSFQIPKDNLIKFEMGDGYLESESNKILHYQVNYPFADLSIIPDSLRPRKLKCKIVLNNDTFVMRILAYYKADFGNDGSADQIFLFQKNIENPILVDPNLYFNLQKRPL